MRLEKKLLRAVGRAVVGYRLIRPHDKIAVALSGGKDSLVLYHLLRLLQDRAPLPFQLQPVYVDAGFSADSAARLTAWVRAQGGDLVVIRQEIGKILSQKLSPGENPCPLCSRLRRGILYRFVRENHFSTLALGHHADDLIETLLLNQFYTGQIKAMPALLEVDAGGIRVIRPLCLAWEEEIARYGRLHFGPAFDNPCPARNDPTLRRKKIKAWLAKLEEEEPGLKAHLHASLAHWQPRFLFPYELQGSEKGDKEEEER